MRDTGTRAGTCADLHAARGIPSEFLLALPLWAAIGTLVWWLA